MIRSDVIRLYKTVHTWTGILTGMALFIAFYAGALTIFKEPLARWASPPAAHMVAVPLSEAATLIARTLEDHPKAARNFQLHLEQDDLRPERMTWRERPTDAGDHDELSARHYAATFHADGTAHIEEVHPSQLAEFIDVLHRVVGLPLDTDPHRWVMGVVVSLYALALISGVVILLPSLVKDFFALRIGQNLKRMWLDSHNVVGIISLPFHLIMVLTAAVFAFHDGIYHLQDRLFHDGRLSTAWEMRRETPEQPSPRTPSELLPPAELVAQALAVSPSLEPTMLQYIGVTTPRAMVRVWGHDPTAISPRALGGFATLDPYTGEVLNTDYLPGKQDGAHTTVSSFFALHFGTFGGTPVQWAYFLLALAGAWLFYSGNLLWIETRRRNGPKGDHPPAQRRDTRWMASGTVGVCLGCVCGISLTIAAAKWLHGHVDNLAAWHQYVYYAVFFGSIAWAFRQGAARAAIHLLWLAAILTWTIPLTTLLAWIMPSLGLWGHTSVASLGVDLTAAVGGLCFAWLARITTQRIHNGMEDSVWSAPTSGAAGRV